MLPESCTFVVPHQRTTSGGVHSIEQFASHLAAAGVEVNLAVRRGPTRPVAGVQVLDAPTLSAAELPAADVVVGGLAQPDPERVLALPPDRGRTVFFFQGHGLPGGSPRVEEMLARRPRVLAVSGFLAERAREKGCAVELVRPGLDRTVFHAGAPCAQRKPVVAMVTHADAGKAMQDGLAALARIREAVPEAELRLFGAATPSIDLPVSFLGKLTREQVAEQLREASVFLCASLEEGLGLPGIEALACGAALASTDTKGSRDYALHERTALVTPPGDGDALADSAIRLLREPELRETLSRRGGEHVLATYPPWPEAAERLRDAMAGLLARERAAGAGAAVGRPLNRTHATAPAGP